MTSRKWGCDDGIPNHCIKPRSDRTDLSNYVRAGVEIRVEFRKDSWRAGGRTSTRSRFEASAKNSSETWRTRAPKEALDNSNMYSEIDGSEERGKAPVVDEKVEEKSGR